MPCKACERRRTAIKDVATKVVTVVSKAFVRKAQQATRLETIRLNRSTGGSQKVDTYD